jgi:hypothetical protein
MLRTGLREQTSFVFSLAFCCLAGVLGGGFWLMYSHKGFSQTLGAGDDILAAAREQKY